MLKLSSVLATRSHPLMKKNNYHLAGCQWRQSNIHIVYIFDWWTIHLNVLRGQLHEQLYFLSRLCRSHGGQQGPRGSSNGSRRSFNEPVWNLLVVVSFPGQGIVCTSLKNAHNNTWYMTAVTSRPLATSWPISPSSLLRMAAEDGPD